jgi:polyketide biosynthesis acyl carrier protein
VSEERIVSKERIVRNEQIMRRNDIHRALERNIRDVMCDFHERSFQPEDSLRDLGANSMDRATIVIQTLAELDVRMPLTAVAQARNLGDLVEIIHSHLQAR